MIKTATWIFLLLFFVGCQGTPKAPNPPLSLQCNVKMLKNSVTYTAQCNSPVLGSYYFEFIQPDSVQGMKVQVENGKVIYSFHELSYSLEYGEDDSLMKQLSEILEYVARGENLVWELNQTQWTGKGRIQQKEFTVVYDKKTNRPLFVKTQDGLQAEFLY